MLNQLPPFLRGLGKNEYTRLFARFKESIDEAKEPTEPTQPSFTKREVYRHLSLLFVYR